MVECALKACIAKKTKEYDFPPPKKTIEKIHTHDLTKLLSESGLRLKESIEVNWTLSKEWYEGIRYEIVDEAKAKEVYAAIIDPEQGVFRWIRQHW